MIFDCEAQELLMPIYQLDDSSLSEEFEGSDRGEGDEEEDHESR